MKSFKFLTMAAIAMMISFNASAQANIADAENFHSNIVKEFNSGNYSLYLSTLHDNFQAYAGVHSPYLFDSKAAWGDFIMGMKSFRAVNYTQRSPQYISVSSSTVICHSYFTFTVVHNDGQTDVQNGRETTVLVNTGQAWKIASMHYSENF